MTQHSGEDVPATERSDDGGFEDLWDRVDSLEDAGMGDLAADIRHALHQYDRSRCSEGHTLAACGCKQNAGTPPMDERGAWHHSNVPSTDDWALAEDLRRTRDERDRLLAFVIQKCLSCGAVTAPDQDIINSVEGMRSALADIAACPNPDSVDDCHNRMSDIAKAALAVPYFGTTERES